MQVLYTLLQIPSLCSLIVQTMYAEISKGYEQKQKSSSVVLSVENVMDT